MTTATPTSDFEQLLATLRDSGDPELVAMRLRIDSLGEGEPALPEAVRLSAIPRDIDATILGVLRSDPDEDENERLLQAMAEAGLLTRSGRVYHFHDRNRATLLRDWRSTPAGVEELARLNAVLSDHHLEEADGLNRLAEDFARVSPLLRTANRARATRLATTIDRRMSATLTRAVRHAFAASAEDGMAVILGRVDALLVADRSTVVSDMLSAAEAAMVERSDDDVPRDRAVLEYYRARSTIVDGQRDSDALLRVSRDPHLPEQYRLWVRDDIATDFETKLMLSEALSLREELAAAPAAQDLWNAAVWAYSLGRLQWRMGLHRAAIISLERSVELAQQPDSRTDMLAPTASMLSLIHAEVGNRPAAARWAVYAFDRVRTDPQAGQWDGFVSRNFANLLAPLDERASAVAWIQGTAGLTDQSSDLVDAAADRLFYLSAVGAVAERDQVVARLADAAARRAITDPETGRVAIAGGYAAEYAGDFRASFEQFDRAVAQLETAEIRERERLLDARYGRARAELRLAMFDRARTDLDAVIAEFTEIGWLGRLAGARLEMARLAVRSGQAGECAELLEVAAREIQQGTWDHAELHRVRGELHLARGEYLAAEGVFDEAERTHVALGNETSAAEVAAMGLRATQDRQDWARASRIVAAARHRLAVLNHRAKVTLTDDQQRSAVAAGTAAAALRSPVAGGIATSRDEVRVRLEAAARLDARCFWYPLELSYLLLEAGRWTEARESVERALSLSPAVVRVPLLHDMVLRLALEELTDAGPGSLEAAHVFDEVSARHLLRASSRLRQPAAEVGVVVAALLGSPESLRVAAGALRRRYRPSDAARQELADRLSAILPDVDAYWRVRATITELVDDSPAMADRLRVVVTALEDWLSVRLGVIADPNEAAARPEIVMRLDIGDDLIPVVDDSQDDGRFLFGLVPELRDRIARLTSVQIPVLRARSEPMLSPTQAVVGVMDAPRAGALIDPGAGALVQPYDPGVHAPGTVLPWHPLDDRPGPWAVYFLDEATDAEGAIDAAQAIAALIELVVVRHLDKYVTVESVRERLDGLASPDLTAEFSGLPDRCAEIKADPMQLATLSVQLRRLAVDVAPVDDRLLAEVLGESRADLSDFETVARRMLGGLLPGREPGRLVVETPDGLSVGWDDPSIRAQVARRLYEWLLGLAAAEGIWLTLVASPGVSRSWLRAIASKVDPLIAVLSREEVAER